MPTLLRRLPFFEDSTTLSIPGGPVIGVKRYQVIVWVSLTRAEMLELGQRCQSRQLCGKDYSHRTNRTAAQARISWIGVP